MNPLVDAAEDRSWYVACMHSPAWDKVRFRRLLQRVMTDAQLTQQDVATLAGVSRSQVSRWQSAAHRPNYDALMHFLAAIRVRHPDVADLAEDMVTAAGYEATAPSGVAAGDDGSYSVTGLSAEEARVLHAYVEGLRRGTGGTTPPATTNGKSALQR